MVCQGCWEVTLGDWCATCRVCTDCCACEPGQGDWRVDPTLYTAAELGLNPEDDEERW